MHPLKAAVLHHRLDAMSALVRDPQVQVDRALAKDLLRIALDMGNHCTITRLARLLPELERGIDARALLEDRMRAMALNHFGGGSLERAARRLWAQLAHGVVEPFSRDEPDFVLTPELKEDFRFLLRLCGVATEAQLLTVSRSLSPAE